jgi:hypothetical protein
MVESQQFQITRQVPLVRLETFCRSLQTALAGQYPSVDVPRIWRLYVSADCPRCGIWICGDELRALALAPCIELASAKIGRMRLGDCARRGCQAWDYSLHFSNMDGIEWPSLLEKAERPVLRVRTTKPFGPPWLGDLARRAAAYAPQAAALLGLILGLWLARQYYLGGRIPFLREPEKFAVESPTLDSTWPAPLDGDGRVTR